MHICVTKSIAYLSSVLWSLRWKNVSALHKYMLCFNTISIRQASIYQSRGDIGLIWMWYSIVYQCFYNFEKLRKSRNGVILLSNPHPRINVSVQQQLYSYNDGKSLRYDMQGWGEYSSCSPPTMISVIEQNLRHGNYVDTWKSSHLWRGHSSCTLPTVIWNMNKNLRRNKLYVTQLEIWSSQYSSPTESY